MKALTNLAASMSAGLTGSVMIGAVASSFPADIVASPAIPEGGAGG